MTPSRPTSREAGFSLVEVMVSLAIVALLGISGAAILTSSIRSKEQIAEASERLRELQTARAVMTMDLAQIAWRPIRDPYGVTDPFVFRGGGVGDADLLMMFARSGWANPGGLEPRGPIQVVSYRVEDGALIRDMRLRPDATPSTPVISRPLLTGVERVDVSFVQDESVELSWEASPTDPRDQALPAIVEMTIYLADLGETQHVFLTAHGR